MRGTAPKLLAWHYTTGEKFVQIVLDGCLVPSDVLVMPPERPVLWFSLNQDFEPTARKLAYEDGRPRTMSQSETMEAGGGLLRFGCYPQLLLTGEKLRTRAHISRQMWDGLRRAGVLQGANPNLWFGSLEPMPIGGMVVEAMNGQGEWERVQEVTA